MPIKRFNDYSTTKAYTEATTLPKGAYVAVIKSAEVQENDRGQYIRFFIDIAEGDYANFFTNDWNNQTGEDKKWRGNMLLSVPNDDGSERDGWTKRRFKTAIVAIEDSNPGYQFDWDEQKFRNKRVGILVNERQYKGNDGSIRTTYNLAAFTSVEAVKTGKYTLPKDRLLEPVRTATAAPDEFIKVPDGHETDGLPF